MFFGKKKPRGAVTGADAMKELKKSFAWVDLVLSGVDEGVFVVGGDWNIIYVNYGLVKMFNTKDALLLGVPPWQAMKLANEYNPQYPLKNDGTPVDLAVITEFNGYYNLELPDETRIVQIEAEYISKLNQAVFLLRDVTKEREIDRAKSEFVSLASHQLRAPLSTISWYIEMLTAGDVGAMNEKQQEYSNLVYQANRRMVDLVNALLNVSRIELGVFSIEPAEVSIVEVVKNALKEQEKRIMQKKLQVEEYYDEKLPKALPLDPNLTHIIFQNLISNAAKYTPEGGKVTVQLVVDEPAKMIRITVADTGFGIPKRQQDKIFSKLFRADNARKIEIEGTGLGLYIVKAILEKVSGSISFESEENKGTTFYAAIPLTGMQKVEGSKSLAKNA